MYWDSSILLSHCNARMKICFPGLIFAQYQSINIIIIRCKCFFLSIGRGPTTWPANNCLQIMVCSCAMPSNCVWLQIIFCTCVKETVLFSFLRSLLRENGRSLRFPKIFLKKQTRWSNDKTIVELGYSKISSASANNWSARQITIFCSTSSNNC